MSFADFQSDAFKVFREKAIGSLRLSKDDLNISDEKLLDTLQLSEGCYLKRAALLLFHQDPEKWVPGSFVKIGMFKTETELLYHHEIYCPLIMMPDKVMEVVYLNYFKGVVSYNGIHRVETFPVPHEAFREAITNAIAHRAYDTGIPIQIKVFHDKVIIYNTARFSQNWNIDNLMKHHSSIPHNPLIAGAFFRSGQIELWGRGIDKILTSCKAWGKPDPTFAFNQDCEFSVTFYADKINNISDSNPISEIQQYFDINTTKYSLNSTQFKLIQLILANKHITAKKISIELGLNERNTRKNIKIIKNIGIIERIGSDKTGF